MDTHGYDIGIKDRNLVLKTTNKIYVKVQDKYYEIDFRNNNKEEKEDQIIKLNENESIDTINYPGDNKLIISNEGDCYYSDKGSYIKLNTSESKHESITVNNQNYITRDEVMALMSNIQTVNTQSSGLYNLISSNVYGILKIINSINAIEVFNDGSGFFNNDSFINLFIESSICKGIGYSTFSNSYEWFENQDEYREDFWHNFFYNTNEEVKRPNELRNNSLIYNGCNLFYFKYDENTDSYIKLEDCRIEDFENIINAIVDTYDWLDYDVEPQDYLNKISGFDGKYYQVNIKSNDDSLYIPFTEISFCGKQGIITSIVDNETIIIKLKNEDDELDSSSSSGQVQTKLPVIYSDHIDVFNNDTYMNSDYKLESNDDISLRVGNLSNLAPENWEITKQNDLGGYITEDKQIDYTDVGSFVQNANLINPTIKGDNIQICPKEKYMKIGQLLFGEDGSVMGEWLNNHKDLHSLVDKIDDILERLDRIERELNIN